MNQRSMMQCFNRMKNLFDNHANCLRAQLSSAEVQEILHGRSKKIHGQNRVTLINAEIEHLGKIHTFVHELEHISLDRQLRSVTGRTFEFDRNEQIILLLIFS